jgi:hypothetical protein
MTITEAFRSELNAQIDRATKQGRPHIEINAGEIHRIVGGYPSQESGHNMPSCCNVMREEMKTGNTEVIHETESGNSASLTIRYHLPRR